MRTSRRTYTWWLLAVVVAACGGDGATSPDAAAPDDGASDGAIDGPVTTLTAVDGTLSVELAATMADTLRATAPQGSTLAFAITAQPTKGTVTIDDAATGAFTYTSTGLVHDVDQFTFEVTDGVHPPSTGTIDVTIEPVLFTGTWALTNLLRNGAGGCTVQPFRIVHAPHGGTPTGFFEIAQRRITCGSTTYTIDPASFPTTTMNPTDTVLVYTRSQSVSGCGTVTDNFRVERTATGFTYREVLNAPCAGGGMFTFTADATRTETAYLWTAPSNVVGNAVQGGAAPTALVPIYNLGRAPATTLAVLTAPALPFTFAGAAYPGTAGTCGAQLPGRATCSVAISLDTTLLDAYASGYLQLSYAGGTITANLSGGVVPSLANVTVVEAGGQYSCVIANGAVTCWGATSIVPTPVPSLSAPTAITSGSYHACALDSTGVHCWGANAWSQATVPALTNPRAIAAGGEHTCALDDTGVVCWGRNLEGQRTVPALTNPTAISLGTRHSCALTDPGVVCWGQSTGTIPALTSPSTISAGVAHNCAMTATGVRCWGSNLYGQTTVPALTSPTAVAAGEDRSCAIVSGGAVTCWGRNSSTTPALTGATAITVGTDFACALATGGLRCWGTQSYP